MVRKRQHQHLPSWSGNDGRKTESVFDVSTDENLRLYQMIQRLNVERRAVIDHLQSRSRQLDISLRLLRRQLAASDLSPREVEVFEPIEPLNSGINMHSQEEDTLPYSYVDGRHDGGRDTGDPRPWWPTIDDETPPLKPSPGWQNIRLLDQTVRTVGILLLGQNEIVIDRVVATFLRQQTQRQDFAPVFIIDSTYTDPFLQHGFVVEMIPPASDQALYVGSKPWQDYIIDRLTIIRDKWYVVQFLEFGKTRYSIHGIADEIAQSEEESADDHTAGSSNEKSPHAAE